MCASGSEEECISAANLQKLAILLKAELVIRLATRCCVRFEKVKLLDVVVQNPDLKIEFFWRYSRLKSAADIHRRGTRDQCSECLYCTVASENNGMLSCTAR